jgi:hypothetical protein
MTNGLVKGRNTIFIRGCAVQWFSTVMKTTKVIIYGQIPGNTWISMCEYTLDYVADNFSVEQFATEKIIEIENLS